MTFITGFSKIAFMLCNHFLFASLTHVKPLPFRLLLLPRYRSINPKQAWGGGGIRPQAGSSLCCAETVSSRKLKLCDFYYILIGLNSEYKPVPWDIHCCHGNAIVEGCSVEYWLKSVENCNLLLKSFSNFNLDLLFVISISKLPLCQISSKSDKKQRS